MPCAAQRSASRVQDTAALPLVRHPLMSGLLLAFWATPHMTAGHLLFAVLSTAYVLFGVRLEENDLITELGESYERYRQRVPMLMPRLSGSSSTVSKTSHGG